MNLNPNIEEIRKELKSKLEIELKNNPDFINSKKIECEKINDIYEEILRNKYPDNLREIGMVIGIKDPLLVDNVMKSLKYEYDYTLEKVHYYLKKQ